MVPWSSGNDAWLTPRKRWFESIRYYLGCSAKLVRRRLRTSEIGFQLPGSPLNYGRQPDTAGRTALLTRLSREGDEGSNPSPSAAIFVSTKRKQVQVNAPMVKWTSFLASNETLRVRLLLGVLPKRLGFGIWNF